MYTVGELISPSSPLIPTETRRPSAPPCASTWQLAQETVPSRESFGSVNSARPSAIRAGSSAGGGGTGAMGSAPAAAWPPANPAPIAPKSITARITVAPVPSVRTAPPVLPPAWLRPMDANARPGRNRTVPLPRVRQRVFPKPRRRPAVRLSRPSAASIPPAARSAGRSLQPPRPRLPPAVRALAVGSGRPPLKAAGRG